MGLGRVIWTGCLGMLCLIPCAWIAFRFFDLGAAITGGLLIDVGAALETGLMYVLPADLGAAKGIIPMLVNGIFGLLMVVFFPIHWSLIYRPDAVDFAIAIIIPWILVGTLTSALFCKSAKKGFDSAMAVGIGYAIIFIAIPFILNAIINNMAGGGGGFNIMDIFDGIFGGLTDLPYIAAVLFACLEGGFIAGVFGAFIGALKYNPDAEQDVSKKSKKWKKETKEPTFGGSSAPTFSMKCPSCGTKVTSEDSFCPQCGRSL